MYSKQWSYVGFLHLEVFEYSRTIYGTSTKTDHNLISTSCENPTSCNAKCRFQCRNKLNFVLHIANRIITYSHADRKTGNSPHLPPYAIQINI